METEMLEPTDCTYCDETFDAAETDAWNAKPFYVVCPTCKTVQYPQPDRYGE